MDEGLLEARKEFCRELPDQHVFAISVDSQVAVVAEVLDWREFTDIVAMLIVVPAQAVSGLFDVNLGLYTKSPAA